MFTFTSLSNVILSNLYISIHEGKKKTFKFIECEMCEKGLP